MSIKTNTTKLQNLLEKVNALPEAGTDTADATAAANEIFAGETAYNASGKVTGTFTIEEELSEQNDLISQIATLVSIKANPQGGTDTADATATVNDILEGETAYVKGVKITGNIPTKSAADVTTSGATVAAPAGYYAENITKTVSTATQATPSIDVNASGLITASATQSSGYVTGGTKSATKQLTTKAAATITPTKSSQTAVAKNVYTTGAITVAAIPNNYITTTDANAVAEDILSGKTAYVNSKKLTGTFTIDSELSTQEDLISQLQDTIDSLPDAGGSGGGQVVPTISVNSSTGLITATAGTKSNTYQLAFQAAKTITPGTTDKTAIVAGCYAGGAVTVKGDSNLVAGNIKNGVKIFGVTGTLTGGNGEQGSNNGYYSNSTATLIASSAFAKCQYITSVTFTKATSIGEDAFSCCYRLAYGEFPMATALPANVFRSCYNLTSIKLQQCTTIHYTTFHDCCQLRALYLPGSSFCNLTRGSEAFYWTPFRGYIKATGKVGSIFVPASLVDTYKSATNWAYFSSRIVAIGTPEEELETLDENQFMLDGVIYQKEPNMTWQEWINSSYNSYSEGFYINTDECEYIHTSNILHIVLISPNGFLEVRPDDIIQSARYMANGFSDEICDAWGWE